MDGLASSAPPAPRGTGNKVFVYLDSANTATSVVVGLYANNASNNPSTLLAQATITSPVNGAWNSVTFPSNVTVAAGAQYWIAVLSPSGGGTVQFRDVATGGRTQESSLTNLTTLPATWSPGVNWANSPMSAYFVSAP